MKKKFVCKLMPLALCCLLVLGGCGSGEQGQAGTEPEQNTPTDSAPAQSPQVSAAPVYDFSSAQVPPGFWEPDEFEHSAIGDPAQTVLSSEQEHGEQIMLVKPAVPILELFFRAEFLFVPGEDGTLSLQSGGYYRDLQLDYRDPLPALEQMTEEYAMLFAYFTQTCGEAERLTYEFVQTGEDGTKQRSAQEVDGFEDFLDSQAVTASAVWRLSGEDGSSWFYRLEMSTQGLLSVAKTPAGGVV